MKEVRILVALFGAFVLGGCLGGGASSWDPVNVARLRVGYDPPRPLPRCRIPVRVLISTGDVDPSYGGYGDYPMAVHNAPTFLTRHLPWALSFYFGDIKVVRRPPQGAGYLLVRAKVYSFGTTKRVIGVGASWGITSRKYRAYVSWRVTVRWVGSSLRPFTHNRQSVGDVEAFRFSASGDIVGSALRQALQNLLKDFLTGDNYRQACVEGRRLHPSLVPRAVPPPGKTPPRKTPPRKTPPRKTPPRKTSPRRRVVPPPHRLEMPK
jgi:hypothetical protein